jgi:hypothetical protein
MHRRSYGFEIAWVTACLPLPWDTRLRRCYRKAASATTLLLSQGQALDPAGQQAKRACHLVSNKWNPQTTTL